MTFNVYLVYRLFKSLIILLLMTIVLLPILILFLICQGDLGTVNLKPKILPSREIPLAFQSKVKQELDNLLKRNVICFVNEPTEWVSQMAVVYKPNDGFGIYIDSQPLNAALQGEHFKLPTIDDPYLN